MPLDLDLSLAGIGAVGEHAGLRRGDFSALGARIAALHDHVVSAASDGLLPHLAVARAPVDTVAGWAMRGAKWSKGRGSVDRVVVLGESAAARAVVALAASSGDPRLASVEGPDAAAVRRGLEGAGRVRLVVLDGPPWVRGLAAGLASRAAAITVVRGDGLVDDDWTIDGAERIDEPGAADPRFAVLGPAALALCAFVGLDVAAIHASIADTAALCSERALLNNPAYRLGSALHLAAERVGRTAPALLVPSGAGPLGEWAVRAWHGITARHTVGPSGPSVPRGATAMTAVHGDESALQRLVGGPPSMVVVSVHGADPEDIPLGETRSVGALAGELVDGQTRFLVGQGQPVIRLRLTRLDVHHFAATAWLWLHAALTVAALGDSNPLSMEGADRWRDFLDAKEHDPHARW